MTLILSGMAIQAGISGLLEGLGIIEISAGQQIVSMLIFAMLAFFYQAGKHANGRRDETQKS